jgi:hypothetical protein
MSLTRFYSRLSLLIPILMHELMVGLRRLHPLRRRKLRGDADAPYFFCAQGTVLQRDHGGVPARRFQVSAFCSDAAINRAVPQIRAPGPVRSTGLPVRSGCGWLSGGESVGASGRENLLNADDV